MKTNIIIWLSISLLILFFTRRAAFPDLSLKRYALVRAFAFSNLLAPGIFAYDRVAVFLPASFLVYTFLWDGILKGFRDSFTNGVLGFHLFVWLVTFGVAFAIILGFHKTKGREKGGGE